VLRREYSGLFQIIAAFALINASLNYAIQGLWNVDSVFQKLLLATTLICAAIWFAVKRTDWLPAPERQRTDANQQAHGSSRKQGTRKKYQQNLPLYRNKKNNGL
jgi:hypothetical protein